MDIFQNIVTLISILTTAVVAIVTPLVTLRINKINKEYENYVRSLEKQYDLFELRRQEMISYINRYSNIASEIVAKLENDSFRRSDFTETIQLGLAAASHGGCNEIINSLEDYQQYLDDPTSGLDGYREILSADIQSSFTGLTTELATISKFQYEILEELREPKKPLLKSILLGSKDSQESQERNSSRKQYLEMS